MTFQLKTTNVLLVAPVVEDLDIVLFNEDKVLKALMVMLIFFHAANDKTWHNAKW